MNDGNTRTRDKQKSGVSRVCEKPGIKRPQWLLPAGIMSRVMRFLNTQYVQP